MLYEVITDGLLKDAIINYLLVMVEVEACKVRDESIKLKYEKLQASKEVIEKKKEAQHRKEAFIKNRITSYNVCYTKLLRCYVEELG